MVTLLLSISLAQELRNAEAEKLVGRIGKIEELLKSGDKAEARKAAAEFSASIGPSRVVWWMFRGQQPRFADLADRLAEAGEMEAARDVAVALADLLSHAGEGTVARLARHVRGNADASFDFLRASQEEPEKAGMSFEDLVQVADRRLEAGTFTERDLELFRHRTGALVLLRKAAGKLPKSWRIQAAWGDAAFRVEKYAEAAGAYAASLDLTKEPIQEEEFDTSRLLFPPRLERHDFSQPRIVRLGVALQRSGGGAEQAIRKYEETSYPLCVADAYHQVGSSAKSATLTRRWLLAHPPREGRLDVITHGLLACRTIESYAAAGMPREAFLARRILLQSLSPDARVAGAIKPVDVLARADRAVPPFAASTLVDEFVAAQKAAEAPTLEKARGFLEGLSSTEPADRDAGAAGLKALGPGVAPFLKASLQAADAEAKGRINGLLEDWALRAAEDKFRKE